MSCGYRCDGENSETGSEQKSEVGGQRSEREIDRKFDETCPERQSIEGPFGKDCRFRGD